MMGRGWDYGYDMMGGNWLAVLLTAFFFALVVAGLIVLAIWLIRSATGHGGHRAAMSGGHGGAYRHEGRSDSGYDFLGPGSGKADDAVEIARRRFAAGEITREQYDDILDALKGERRV